MRNWQIVFVAIILSLTGYANAQNVISAPAPRKLIPSGSGVVFDFSHMTVRSGSVKNGDAIVHLPFSYNRTGVLRNDVSNSLRKSLVWLPAGSPGFFAGRFGSKDGSSFDLWCFYSLKGKPGDLPLCVGNFFGKPGGNFTYDIMWAQAPFFDELAITNNSGGFITEPIIDEGPVDFHRDFYVDLVIRKWDNKCAFPEWYFGAKRISNELCFTNVIQNYVYDLGGQTISFQRDPNSKGDTIVTLSASKLEDVEK